MAHVISPKYCSYSFIHSFSFTSILPSFLTYLIIVQWLIRRPDEEGLSASLIKHWTSMKDYIKDVSAVSLNFLSSCSVFLLAQNPKSGVSFLSFLHFMDFAFSTLFFSPAHFLGPLSPCLSVCFCFLTFTHFSGYFMHNHSLSVPIYVFHPSLTCII